MSTADYKESDTRAKLIDPALYAAQWVEQVAKAERDSHGEIHRPSFQRIERATHFLCYRRADRDSHRMTAFRDWLYAQAGAVPPEWP